MPMQDGTGPEGMGPMTGRQGEAPQEGGANPVVGAIETLAKFVAAQTEQQNPQASAMQAWLQQGIELFSGGGEPEAEAPVAPPAPKEAPVGENADINAGAGSTPVL